MVSRSAIAFLVVRSPSVGKETELLGLALAVVEDNGALPAALLVVVNFAKVGEHLLAGTGGGTNALDQGIVGVLLAVFGPSVAAEEHSNPLVLSSMACGHGTNQGGRANPAGLAANPVSRG
jgi:hypothetical protein